MSDERVCCQCNFWDQKTFHQKERNFGWCRVNPPIRNGTDEREWSWPDTYDEDWCGEWVQLVRTPELPKQKMHDPVSAYEEQNWRSRGDSEEDIAARVAARGRG